MSHDWIPAKREDILAMAVNWKEVFAVRAAEWKITTDETTAFNALITEAKNGLAMLTSAAF
jgi:hypothetical protein